MKVLSPILLLLIALAVGRSAKFNLEEKCKRARSDILLVLDASLSVGPKNWQIQIGFLKAITEAFTVGPTKTRIGVITFGTDASYPIKLEDTKDMKTLGDKILRLKYTEYQTTAMGEGLEVAYKALISKGRKGVNKIVILVTDGRSNGWINPVKMSKNLKKLGIAIITVGITSNINKKQLRRISTSGTLFLVKNFQGLRGAVVERLKRSSCRAVIVKICKKRKGDLTFILDSSTSVGPDHWKDTLNFVERLTDPLFIGKNSGRVALMTFNTRPKLQFLYKKYLNKVVLLKKGIRPVAFTEGLTYTGEALRFFRKRMYPKMRKGVAKVVVLITDGHANGDVNELKEVARLKRRGVQFISVGVTNAINKRKLIKISSSKKVYYAKTFEKLKDIVALVQGEECIDFKKWKRVTKK